MNNFSGYNNHCTTNKNKNLVLKLKQILIGGGRPELYGQYFFEVGDHPTSNYGHSPGQDWTTLVFWQGLHALITGKKYKFKVIMFDSGSESWLANCPDDVIDCMVDDVFSNCLDKDGIIMMEFITHTNYV